MRPHSRSILAMSLILVTLAVRAPAQDESQERPRSVLFYLVDTCRNDRMGFEGYQRETTPFLEWLAERSVVFEACYSQAPWTKPSMASLLSSQYPSTHGVYRLQQRLEDEFQTWPEVLQANGIYTAGFSANIVMGNSLSNFAQGFDHFIESTFINLGDPIRFASGSAEKLNKRAFAWLDRTDHWPMLLYLHSVDPHEEYEPKPEYLERFADPQRHLQFRQEWQELIESRPLIPGLFVTQDNFDRTHIDAASFLEHASNLYDADVRANDDQLARLWDKLQEEGWGEDFIFVFTSDHGEEFFEHGGTSHGYSLYEEMIRVPLMIHAPGLVPGGTRIQTPVRSLDIYPTLCDLLGLDVPEGLQGESLVPLMRGEDPRDAPEIYSQHREDPALRAIGHGSGILVSLRTARWKFLLNQRGSQLIDRPRFELYDLKEDPGERNNVAEAHPDVVEALERKVLTHLASQRRGEELPDGGPIEGMDLEQLRALGYVGAEQTVVEDLWSAMADGDAEQLEHHLDAGADPNQFHEALGTTPLFMAAANGQLDLATILVDAGADVDGRNKDMATPLHGAAFFGQVEVLALLLEEGADRNAKNGNGDSVLSATTATWGLTQLIGDILQVPLDREAIEAGRKECAALLRS